MTAAPFTLADATDVCEDFEDLVDTDINLGKTLVLSIDNVLVSPFNEADKHAFAERYHLTQDAAQSITAYTGEEYDVIIYAINEENPSGFTYMDIATFTEQAGIQYNFPGDH